MKQPKERVIYDNYDLWGSLSEAAREYLEEVNDHLDLQEEPADSEIWEEIYFLDRINWEEERERLEKYFTGTQYMIRGTVGRWNGTFPAGIVFTDFGKMFSDATTDCDYWKIWDENGHLFIKCSHHDGTNLFEIKRITAPGATLLEKWESDYYDPRTEEEIHATIWNNNFYSALPHFAHNVYGCNKREAKTA